MFSKFWTPHFSILNSTLFFFNSTFWLDSTLKLICVHKLIDLVHVYENLTCSISTQLNCPGKTWKMHINGSGKSWKMHTKRSWKVTENHFQCSVCTLVWLCCTCHRMHVCLWRCVFEGSSSSSALPQSFAVNVRVCYGWTCSSTSDCFTVRPRHIQRFAVVTERFCRVLFSVQ